MLWFHIGWIIYGLFGWIIYSLFVVIFIMFVYPVDISGTAVGESPDFLLLSGTVVGENPDHVCCVYFSLSHQLSGDKSKIFSAILSFEFDCQHSSYSTVM